MSALATTVVMLAAAWMQDETQPRPQRAPPFFLFVALDGDDAWSGLAATGDGKGDGPMRSPQAALKRLRELRAADSERSERVCVIHLAAGTWYLDAPLEIGPEDTQGLEYSLLIEGEEKRETDEHSTPKPEQLLTTLSGARRITGWRAQKFHGLDVWVADVPDLDGRPWTFRELFVDGRRCTRARHPDRGYLAIVGVLDADANKPWTEGVRAIRIAPGDVAVHRESLPADLTLMSRWVESHCRIGSIDGSHGLLVLRDKTVFKPDPGDLCYVESFDALDQPGEWWLDVGSKLVYFAPRPEDTIDRSEIVAPRLTRLVTIAGRDDPKQRVHGVGVAALRFEGAEWWYPTTAGGDGSRSSGATQAAVDVPAAIDVSNAEDVFFSRCEITRCGTYGIAFGRGCRGDHVSGWIHDLGAGGVKIGETSIPDASAETAGNHVHSCSITDLGRIFHSAVGVWIGQSPDNRIEECTIGDLYYTGISIGWTWGYGAAHAGGNRVERNEIHHVGVRSDGDGPILSDMGGIYTLGTQEGTLVYRNFFHDVAAFRYGGWGIYFDEGSTHIDASDNFVVNTTHGGFHQHYGKENHVHHNLFAYGRDAQLQRTRPDEHASFTFDHNVIVARGGELFAGDLRDGHFDFHRNVYELVDAASARFAGRSFVEWQAAGRDAESIVAPIDVVNELDANGGQFDPQRWFALRSSAIWSVLHTDSLSGNPRLDFEWRQAK